ncbi:type II toxin-antitoxin system Phd/YefM family antitoxin [Kutzneria sp. CA-103260]|uniref:type II toxin-antitoxin system Phd/YefM family antitoxin n=1 Tax=Kutzneria sp. CA-103260 TaxID=2802641 RepID=UPI001BA89012|nr:type II toxin-antitoxin system Phd/YefM family antitoxin [Kutzneria sp. CA-103260]QUQ71468.1 Antitoxin Phd_YefM, type II toxin-antitoxin system [Kutzneria sp. CA-103260]
MRDRRWQLQEAKQRFSELIRFVESEGPQIVTRHGEEIAVVVDIADWRRVSGASDTDFKFFLRFGSTVDEELKAELETERSGVPARVVDFEADT